MERGRVLIGFGASSMQGVGDSQGGWFARAERLAAGRGAYRAWVNMGVGGDTTSEMLNRADAAAARGEHDVVVMLGCNDLPRAHDGRPERRKTLEVYEANLQLLWSKIAGRRSLLISSFPVDSQRVGTDERTFEQYMDAAMSTAKAAGMEVWDLYRELRDGSAAALTSKWAKDGVHFNDAGHSWIAEQFVERWLSQ